MRGVGRPALPRHLRRPLAAVAVAGAVVVGVMAVLFAGESRGTGLDEWVYATLLRSTPLSRTWDLALAVDYVGEPGGVLISVTVLAGLSLALRRPRMAVVSVAAPLLSGGVTSGLKHLVERSINGGFLSYPSGHTAFATALGIVLSLLAVGVFRLHRPAGLACVAAGTLLAGGVMAWSQTLLIAHYATDTLGGLCTALVVVPFVAWIVDETTDRYAASPARIR
jgi:undecaprenyl-diphosphatase